MVKQKRYSLVTEFTSSLVVFLVALPLCMGISIASGVPPIYGIISGIIGGLVVGALSGSPLQVSGPAAGLAVMVFEYVQKFGLAALVPLGIIIGVVQLVAYKLKIGVFFKAVSPSLLKGLLCGIGVLIFLSQLYVALDLKPIGNGIDNLIGFPKTLIDTLLTTQSALVPFLLCLGAIGVILGWQKLDARITRVLPAPLIGVTAASIVANVMDLKVSFVSIPNDIFSELNLINLNSFDQLSVALVVSAFGIALVASAETLLCTKATDIMSKSGTSDYNKEIMAQGVGHIIAGMLGVIPITGVIVRSTANIQSGAKTRISAILHGLWLLVLVFAAPQILEVIPVTALAAILLVTGVKLMDFKGVYQIFKSGRENAIIFVSTITMIVSIDLLTGVLAGFVMSLIILLYDLQQLEMNQVDDTLHIKGRLSFLQIPMLNSHLSKIEGNSTAILDLNEVDYLDHGAREEIINWKSIASAQGKNIKVIPPKKNVSEAIF